MKRGAFRFSGVLVLGACASQMTVSVRVENQALATVHGAEVIAAADGEVVDRWVTDSTRASYELRFPRSADSVMIYVVAEGYRLGCSVIPVAMSRGEGGLTYLLSGSDTPINRAGAEYIERCRADLEALVAK